MAKSIKRNFLYNILLNISSVIFPLITAPYVSRVLEPEGVGLSNFANTYAGYFALFAALGIPMYGVREIAKLKDDISTQTKFVSEIISISFVATIICTVIMLLTLAFIPQLNKNYIVFLVAGIVLYLTPFKIDWYYRGKENFGYITLRSLVIKTLSVVLLFVFVHKKEDLLIYVGLNAACQVINDMWNYIKLYKSGIHPYFTLAGKEHIKPLLILLSSSLAISIYALLDTLMLGFMKDYQEVGYFNSAFHLSRALIPIVTSLSTVILPRITQYKENNKWDEIESLINKSFSLIGYLSSPISFGIIAVAPVFVPLFFGDLFYGAILPLQIVILTVMIVGFNNLTGVQILLGLGLDKLFLYSILAGTFSSFMFNLVLIPILGAVGAAISSIIAESVVLLSMVWFIYLKTPIRFKGFKDFFLSLFASIFFIPIGCYFKQYFFGWFYIFIVMIVCGSFYTIIQFIFKNSSQIDFVFLLKRTLNKKQR